MLWRTFQLQMGLTSWVCGLCHCTGLWTWFNALMPYLEISNIFLKAGPAFCTGAQWQMKMQILGQAIFSDKTPSGALGLDMERTHLKGMVLVGVQGHEKRSHRMKGQLGMSHP